METSFQISLQGYATVDREVKNGGNSGRIFVPKAWAGKKVQVVLLEPLENAAK
jgi:putative transposon-encoded protein